MHLRERMLARLPRSGRPYEIKNADGAGGPAVLRIYEEIGFFGVTAEDVARDLQSVTASEIEVQIASPGGDVFDGLAIFNALRAHEARVVTRVDGVAASAASVIAQAGDQRVMLESSQMMIHEPWGLAIGAADEMREFADLLDMQAEEMANLYANRAGGDADEFREQMRAETWMSAQETVDAGLADEVVVPERRGSAATTDTVNASPEPTPFTPDQIDALAASVAERLNSPPASERQAGTTTDDGEPDVVDPAEADRLLSELTFHKEAQQ